MVYRQGSITPTQSWAQKPPTGDNLVIFGDSLSSSLCPSDLPPPPLPPNLTILSCSINLLCRPGSTLEPCCLVRCLLCHLSILCVLSHLSQYLTLAPQVTHHNSTIQRRLHMTIHMRLQIIISRYRGRLKSKVFSSESGRKKFWVKRNFVSVKILGSNFFC